MKKEEIRRGYDAAAKTYAERCFRELDGKPLDRLLLDRFARESAGKGVICDMGCGPGEVADYLVTRHPAVTGIDISPAMVEEARHLVPAASFMVGDMFDLEMDDASLAGIAAFYAFVNFRETDLPPAFQEFRRVLVPGGQFLTAFHVWEEVIHVDDFFDGGEPLDFHYFDTDRILGMLENAGFRIGEALVRYPYPDEYPSHRAYITAFRDA